MTEPRIFGKILGDALVDAVQSGSVDGAFIATRIDMTMCAIRECLYPGALREEVPTAVFRWTSRILVRALEEALVLRAPVFKGLQPDLLDAVQALVFGFLDHLPHIFESESEAVEFLAASSLKESSIAWTPKRGRGAAWADSLLRHIHAKEEAAAAKRRRATTELRAASPPPKRRRAEACHDTPERAIIFVN